MSAVQNFLDAAATRRSVYTIKDTDSPLSEKEIESVVKRALEICPSPWNICSSRCVILFGDNHKKFFGDVILPAMRASLPAAAFASFEDKIKGYAAGMGTVLIFEDQKVWDDLVAKSPSAAPLVGTWANNVTGMLQYIIWTALSVGGLGCSLQHYGWSEDVVGAIRKDFNVPESWVLKAELVFGAKYEEPGERPSQPSTTVEERFKVVG